MLNHLDNYYFSLPEPQQSCLLFLRNFMLEYSPDITEHFKYGGAFFNYKGKSFAYLTTSKKTGKTYIGFVNGNLIKHKKLQSEGRSQIKVFYVDPEKDVDLKSLKEIMKLACSSYK
jgi:hypothetical protein